MGYPRHSAQGTTYRSAGNAGSLVLHPLRGAIDSPLGQARVTRSEHDPRAYAPSLIPGVRPYCYACNRRVPRDGCAPYLTATRRLDEANDAGHPKGYRR